MRQSINTYSSSGQASFSAIKRLVPYLWPYRGAVLAGLCLLIIQICAELFPPIVWKYVVDTFLASGLAGQLAWALVALAAAYAVAAGVNGLRVFFLTKAAQGFIYDLRRSLYTRLQEQPLSYFQDQRTGDLLSRVMSDVDVVQEVLITGADLVIASALRVLGVAVIFVWLQPIIGLFVIMPMVVVALTMRYYNNLVKPIYRRTREELGEVAAKLQDNLSGISVIKAFAREDYEEGQFEEAARAYYDASVAGIGVRSRYYPVVRFSANLGQVVMLGLGAWMIHLGRFTVGGLVAYRGYGRFFYGPIDDLMSINDMLQRASAASERIFEVIDHAPAVQDKDGAIEMPAIRGDVEFRDVTFSYRARVTVLSSINLTVRAGQTVGFFGPSGIGKTTMLNLIPRFYDPVRGSVLIDGVDIRDVTQASLRRQIGIVQQDTFLFNSTVIENIRYGKLDATDEEVVQAARMANADAFISQLPEGYHTEIGERGTKLSGGQKQRLSIARCFLADPAIMLMDEPTSAVEPDSERAIIEALQSLARGRTTFIVSHRLNLLRHADLIVSLVEGKIERTGTHEELLALGGAYAHAWRLSEA